MTDQVSERISEYLQAGGLFNPEAMDHDKVRDLLIECRDHIDALAAENAKLRKQVDSWRSYASYCNCCAKWGEHKLDDFEQFIAR